MNFRKLDFGRYDYIDNLVLLEPDELPDGADVVEVSGDEPLFLLRAQDILAANTVRAWAQQLEDMGGHEPTVIDARKRADAMDAWRRRHGGQMPDAP